MQGPVVGRRRASTTTQHECDIVRSSRCRDMRLAPLAPLCPFYATKWVASREFSTWQMEIIKTTRHRGAIHTHARARAHARTHAHARARMHTRAHAHIDRYARAHKLFLSRAALMSNLPLSVPRAAAAPTAASLFCDRVFSSVPVCAVPLGCGATGACSVSGLAPAPLPVPVPRLGVASCPCGGGGAGCCCSCAPSPAPSALWRPPTLLGCGDCDLVRGTACVLAFLVRGALRGRPRRSSALV